MNAHHSRNNSQLTVPKTLEEAIVVYGQTMTVVEDFMSYLPIMQSICLKLNSNLLYVKRDGFCSTCMDDNNKAKL